MYTPWPWFNSGPTWGYPMAPFQGYATKGYNPYWFYQQPDVYQRSNSEATSRPKEPFSWSRAIGSFLKGGTIDVVKSMLTLQGLLMIGGTFALTVATQGAIIPFLIPIGLAMGGYQIAKGTIAASDQFQKGDNEAGYEALAQIGTGVSTIGLSAWGARATYAKGAIQGKPANPDITYRQTLSEMVNDLRGKNRIHGKHLAQTAWNNLLESFRNFGKHRSHSSQGTGNSLIQGMTNHVHTEHGLVMPPGNNNNDQKDSSSSSYWDGR